MFAHIAMTAERKHLIYKTSTVIT